MILAAGRGKRLRPITDTIPKPLVEVAGKPLIEYHLEKLAQAGVQDVVINHAWLGHKIESALGNGSRWGLNIHYSAEPEGGLETAGGIINALPLLGSHPFLVINGDIYCDMSFNSLITQAELMSKLKRNPVPDSIKNSQIASCNLGHVVLVPSPKHNQSGDFGLQESGLVEAEGEHTFSGLSVLSPELFTNLEVGFVPLAPILREAMSHGEITGQLERGFWSDVGTLERLQQTEEQIKA